MNLNDNSSKKIKMKYLICIIIFLLINSFIVINIKIVLSLLFINRVNLSRRSSVVVLSKELVFFVYY